MRVRIVPPFSVICESLLAWSATPTTSIFAEPFSVNWLVRYVPPPNPA